VWTFLQMPLCVCSWVLQVPLALSAMDGDRFERFASYLYSHRTKLICSDQGPHPTPQERSSEEALSCFRMAVPTWGKAVHLIPERE